MGTEFVLCYIEGKRYPKASCHVHHLRPRHAGGGDQRENLVYLSANAHQMVHRAAQMLKAGKVGHANDLAMAAYPSPAQRQRFMEVVQTEVSESKAAVESNTGSASIVVEVPIPRNEYAKLKMLVTEKSVKGRKISISDYVKNLVLAHVNRSIR
jgi:hypothetical protein